MPGADPQWSAERHDRILNALHADTEPRKDVMDQALDLSAKMSANPAVGGVR